MNQFDIIQAQIDNNAREIGLDRNITEYVKLIERSLNKIYKMKRYNLIN
jgi:hypothetical protein